MCRGAGGHVYGADNREVADAVTALTDWALMLPAPLTWPPCSPPLLALRFRRVGSLQREEKISVEQTVLCGKNELKRGEAGRVDKALNGDITCSRCGDSAQLAVIGCTTCAPVRLGAPPRPMWGNKPAILHKRASFILHVRGCVLQTQQVAQS